MTDLQARIDRVMEPTGNVSFDDIRKRDAEMVSIIKELKFELDEAQTDAEIWENTDINSQAIIKELQAQLSAKDAKIKERDELITIYARDVRELQHELKAKDALIAELRNQLYNSNDIISNHAAEWGLP